VARFWPDSASTWPAPGCWPATTIIIMTTPITAMSTTRTITMRTRVIDEHHHVNAHDTNLRAAYVHVLADAVTSVLAVVALLAGGSTAGCGWIRRWRSLASA